MSGKRNAGVVGVEEEHFPSAQQAMVCERDQARLRRLITARFRRLFQKTTRVSLSVYWHEPLGGAAADALPLPCRESSPSEPQRASQSSGQCGRCRREFGRLAARTDERGRWHRGPCGFRSFICCPVRGERRPVTLTLFAVGACGERGAGALEPAAALLRICVAGFGAALRAERTDAAAQAWQKEAQVMGLEVKRLGLELHAASPTACQPSLRKPEAHEQVLAQRMLDYIHAHYQHPMSLGEMAAAFGLSSSYLSTVFHHATASHFHDYLDLLRLKRAVALLADPARPIADVAAQAGYASDTWFRHAFKAHTGLSPSEWRAQHRVLRAES